MSLRFCRGSEERGRGAGVGPTGTGGGSGAARGLTWSTKSSSTKVATLPLMPMKRLMHVRAT